MSVASDIADAIVTAVQGLDLVASGNVARRKQAGLPQGKDPPAITVTVGEKGEFVQALTGRKDLVKYTAVVAIITSGGHKQTDDTTLQGWRESIRGAVNKPSAFTTVSQFNQVDPDPRPVYSGPALAKDLNASLIGFFVEAIEDRAR